MRLVPEDRHLAPRQTSPPEPKLCDGVLAVRDLWCTSADGLHYGSRADEEIGIFRSGRNEDVHVYGADLGNVAEANFLLEKRQNSAASRASEGAVFEVGIIAFPFSQAFAGRSLRGAWRGVEIGEGNEVRGDGRFPGLLQAREVEGAGEEVSGLGVGAGGGLDGM